MNVTFVSFLFHISLDLLVFLSPFFLSLLRGHSVERATLISCGICSVTLIFPPGKLDTIMQMAVHSVGLRLMSSKKTLEFLDGIIVHTFDGCPLHLHCCIPELWASNIIRIRRRLWHHNKCYPDDYGRPQVDKIICWFRTQCPVRYVPNWSCA